MRNYIRADIKRILQRSSHLFSMLLLFAIYAIVLYIPNRNSQVTSVTLVASACDFLQFMVIFIGLFEMIAVFSEDFKVKTMQVAIGLGVSRSKVVLCKLLETLILLVLDFVVITLITMGVGVMLNAPLGAAVLKDLGYMLLVNGLLGQAIVISLTMIVMFMTHSTVLSIFVYILIGIDIVNILLTFMPMFGLNWLEDLNLTRLTLNYLLGALHTRLVLGSFDFPAFLGTVIYLFAGIFTTCKLFSKTELDF